MWRVSRDPVVDPRHAAQDHRAMTTSAAPNRSPSKLARWSLLGGALYVVLFIVGVSVGFNGEPDTSKSQDKVLAYWAKSSHRDKLAWGWILVGLGVFFFLWFVAALRQRIRAADPDGFYATVATIGGVVYATTGFAALSLEVGIKSMSDDTFHHTVYPELIHAADDAGWVMHAGGAIGISALIIAASLAARRMGAVPGWLAWVSVVVGVLSLGAIAFFPILLFFLWLLIVSIAMFIRAGRAPSSA
jgi:hypothetical protein